VDIVNLTPHPVVVVGDEGQTIAEFPPSGTVARLSESATPDGATPSGIPLTNVALGEIIGLPGQVTSTLYIVSMPLLMGAIAAEVTRSDLVYPYGQVRDASGRIIGCRSLGTVASA